MGPGDGKGQTVLFKGGFYRGYATWYEIANKGSLIAKENSNCRTSIDTNICSLSGIIIIISPRERARRITGAMIYIVSASSKLRKKILLCLRS